MNAEKIMQADEEQFWAEAEAKAKGRTLPPDAFERMCRGEWFGSPAEAQVNDSVDEWGSSATRESR